jgi:hypothetical protein
MPNDVVSVLTNLQEQLQIIPDLALIAPAQEKASLLRTADLLEQCIREFDKQA